MVHTVLRLYINSSAILCCAESTVSYTQAALYDRSGWKELG